MEKDDLSYVLVSAVEETEKDKEIEKQADATFVSADPEDYNEEGYYEGDDIFEEEERYYIENSDFHMLVNTIQSAQYILDDISIILTAETEEQLPLLSVNNFSELTQLLSETKSRALVTKDLACDYVVN